MSGNIDKVRKKSFDRTPSKVSKFSNGLFSKVSQLFAIGKTAQETNDQDNENDFDDHYNFTHMNSDQSVVYRPGRGYYGAGNTSDMSNISITSKNANETLADFFTKKGSEPLSEIELEGVVSLLQKANQSGIQDYHQNDSFFALSPRRLSAGESDTKPVNSKIDKTPMRQFSATYRTPGRLEKTRGPMTTKKRIVQYSKLPSPYRTRISSPLTSYMESRENSIKRLPESSEFNLGSSSFLIDSSIALPDTAESKSKRVLSSTASTLLSSLENKSIENKRKPSVSFSNPYTVLPKRRQQIAKSVEDKKVTANEETSSQAVVDAKIAKETAPQVQENERKPIQKPLDVVSHIEKEESLVENKSENLSKENSKEKFPSSQDASKAGLSSFHGVSSKLANLPSVKVTTEEKASEPATVISSFNFGSSTKTAKTDKEPENPTSKTSFTPTFAFGTPSQTKPEKQATVYDSTTESQTSTKQTKAQENIAKSVVSSFDFPDLSDTNKHLLNYIGGVESTEYDNIFIF